MVSAAFVAGEGAMALVSFVELLGCPGTTSCDGFLRIPMRLLDL